MTDYPVTFDVVARPANYQRVQVLIAWLVSIVLGVVTWLAYIAFPIMAAIGASSKGSQKFLDEDGPKTTGWVRSIIAYYSYAYFLTNRLPGEGVPEQIKLEVQCGGNVTVGSALLRWIFSIPSAIVVGVLGWVAAILWLVAAVMILIQGSFPEGIYTFQLGVLRWHARLLGYHASLVEQYPPFALDMETQAPAGGA